MFDKNKFRACVVGLGYTLDDVAKELGINVATLHRKINGNSDFTRMEVHNIMKILHLSFDEMEKIFFTNKLTETQDDKQTKAG